MSYNYYDSMREDIIDAISDNMTLPELIDALKNDSERLCENINAACWIDDSVTGNASGSYTFNRLTAREYVLDNMDLLHDAMNEFGCESSEVGEHFINEDWEWFDVVIRCVILSCVIDTLVNDLMGCIEALEAETRLTSSVLETVLEAA